MPKKKERRYDENGNPIRMSEFARDRECYMTTGGGYTYRQWQKDGKGDWQLRTVCSVPISEDGASAEVTIALDDADCAVDRQENRIRKERDGGFELRRADYESTDEDSDQKTDPWDKVAYDQWVREQNEPEDSTDDRMPRLVELLDTLTDEQRELIRMHLNMNMQFEAIARLISDQSGKPISRQAVSKRWYKILSILRRGFGISEDSDKK